METSLLQVLQHNTPDSRNDTLRMLDRLVKVYENSDYMVTIVITVVHWPKHIPKHTLIVELWTLFFSTGSKQTNLCRMSSSASTIEQSIKCATGWAWLWCFNKCTDNRHVMRFWYLPFLLRGFIRSLWGVDRGCISWGSGRGLIEVYQGWTDAASAGDLEEVD